MRVCLLATRLGRLVVVDELDLGDVYYTALLRYLGCNGALRCLYGMEN